MGCAFSISVSSSETIGASQLWTLLFFPVSRPVPVDMRFRHKISSLGELMVYPISWLIQMIQMIPPGIPLNMKLESEMGCLIPEKTIKSIQK